MRPTDISEQFLKDIRLFYLAATTKSREFIPLYNKAVALYRLYRFQTAANTFQKLVELDPRFIQGYYMKGLCLRKLNKFEEAKEEFNRSLSLNSAFIESYFQLACIYEELEELEKANTCLDNYIHFDQSNAEVFFKKGVNLCELGCTLEAQHHLQHAVELDPGHYNAHFYVGFLLYKTYSFSPALIHFKKTIDLEKDYIGALTRGLLLPRAVPRKAAPLRRGLRGHRRANQARARLPGGHHAALPLLLRPRRLLGVPAHFAAADPGQRDQLGNLLLQGVGSPGCSSI